MAIVSPDATTPPASSLRLSKFNSIATLSVETVVSIPVEPLKFSVSVPTVTVSRKPVSPVMLRSPPVEPPEDEASVIIVLAVSYIDKSTSIGRYSGGNVVLNKYRSIIIIDQPLNWGCGWNLQTTIIWVSSVNL